MHKFTFFIRLDTEQLGIVLGAAEFLRLIEIQRLRAYDSDTFFVVKLEPTLRAEGDEEWPLRGGR